MRCTHSYSKTYLKKSTLGHGGGRLARQETCAVENKVVARRRGEPRHRISSKNMILRQLTPPGLPASWPSPAQKPQWKAISLPRIHVNLFFCPLILPLFVLSQKWWSWTQLKWGSSLFQLINRHFRDAWMTPAHQSLGMWCLLSA